MKSIKQGQRYDSYVRLVFLVFIFYFFCSASRATLLYIGNQAEAMTPLKHSCHRSGRTETLDTAMKSLIYQWKRLYSRLAPFPLMGATGD